MVDRDSRTEPKRLKGFRDYLPDLMATRLSLMDVIRSEARRAGFQPIGTPALEYAETLIGHGEETDKQVYRFVDHGERDVALRFDLTVPFARFVAEHQGQLTFPFKKLQMGEVWRGENTQKGRYREFAQCDLDIIGVDSVMADVEVLTAFQRILSRMNFGPFTMAVGSRVVLSALIRHLLPDINSEGETSALIAIDKLAKVGPAKVTDLLAAIPGASPGGAGQLLEVLMARDKGGNTDLTAVRKSLSHGVSASEALASGATFKANEEALTRLESVLDLVRRGSVGGSGRALLDLTVARGLGYYTGVVFETTIDALPGFGSICSGGRYNDLASRFTTRELPGVGGSIGLDRLLAGLEELGKVTSATGGMVFIAVATNDALGYACDILRSLRDAGFASDVGLTAKLGHQFKHADRLACPYVITVGTDEAASSTCTIKSMADGQEERGVAVSQLVPWLESRGLTMGR
jgi:histidyl-tRNA synthetase